MTASRAQLRELVDRDQAATGAWIAGGRQGADPGDAADTPSLVDRVAAMQPELAAARRTLPAAEQRHRPPPNGSARPRRTAMWRSGRLP